MQDVFDDFVHRYQGPKLAFVVTGGGIGIHQLAQTLGASRILHAIHVPYSYEESQSFIYRAYVSPKGKELGSEYKQKAVSARGADLLCMAGARNWPNCKVISCTASTTTNRWRRGENEAFLSLVNPTEHYTSFENKVKRYHKKVSKLDEEDYNRLGLDYAQQKRREEDREITRYILKLALGEIQ